MKDTGNKRKLENLRKALVEAIESEKNIPTVIAMFTREIPSALDNFKEQSEKEAAIIAKASGNLLEVAKEIQQHASDMSLSGASLQKDVSSLNQEVAAAMQHVKASTQAIESSASKQLTMRDESLREFVEVRSKFTSWMKKVLLFTGVASIIILTFACVLTYNFYKQNQANVYRVNSDVYKVGSWVEQAQPQLWMKLKKAYEESEYLKTEKGFAESISREKKQ